MAATSSCSSYSTWTSTVRAFRSSSVVWARPSRRMRIIRSRTMGWIKRWAFLSAPAARAVKSGYQKSGYWNYTWSRAEATPRRHQPAPSSLVGKVRFTPIPVGSEYLPPRVGADLCVRPGTPPHGTRLRADIQVGPYDPPASSIDPGQRAGAEPVPTEPRARRSCLGTGAYSSVDRRYSSSQCRWASMSSRTHFSMARAITRYISR